MRAQGWEPGKFLGAQNSAHSHLHSAASSAPIKVTLKDDTLGLGAKPREKQSAECTGLDGFKDLLGRLNGKSEEIIKKEQQVRSEIKTNLYVERRYGTMRFVRGGLLVGDQIQQLADSLATTTTKVEKASDDESPVKLEDVEECPEKKQKKEKKSKKRKAEEPDSTTDGPDTAPEKKRKKRSKDETSQGDSAEESRRKKKKSKRSKREDDGAIEPTDPENKKKNKKSKKDPERATKSDDTPIAPEDPPTESKQDKKERRKKEKKEKKQKRPDTSDSSTEVTASADTPISIPIMTPQESSISTPVSGTSTPQVVSARHLARSRNLASKRMAIADLKAMNQVSFAAKITLIEHSLTVE